MNTELDRILEGSLSRRTMLKTAAVGFAGVTLGQLGCRTSAGTAAQAEEIRELAAGSERVQDILNVTATVEGFGVTFLGAGIESAEQNRFNKPWPANVLAVVKAARAQEKFHLDFFESAGGRAFVDAFTIPPAALADFNTFFGAVVEQEGLEIAAQLAAIRTYAGLKRPDLMKVSFQYAAEEAEHRILANYTLGARPANDIAFAPMSLSSTSAIIDSMKKRGLINGGGTRVAFPGPGTIDATNVINTRPDGPSA
ncbi:MAG: hypothetical protein ACREMS_08755 [Gemmatimonadaceae bacterium]